MMAAGDWLSAEIHYHEKLYAGTAQSLFARPAVRAFRARLVQRILQQTGAGFQSRVLSLGCGIGDTELLLARHVGSVCGVDASPAAIRQAEADRERASVKNAQFYCSTVEAFPASPGSFDAVVAVFFLHHLPEEAIDCVLARSWEWLRPGGVLYALDPNRFRLSGALGRLLVPHLMERYHSPGERELDPAWTLARVKQAGFEATVAWFDFWSTPVAGLWPESLSCYHMAWWIDRLLTRIPLLRRLGSNFEIVARKISQTQG